MSESSPLTSFVRGGRGIPSRILRRVASPKVYTYIIGSRFLKNRAFREPGTLNSQQQRGKAVKKIIADFDPHAVVETGCYLGAGTKFFLNNSTAPIYTCEINGHYANFSQARFKKESRVNIYSASSVDFLKKISDPVLSNEAKIFFYLDAHWAQELPLKEEIQIILKRWRNSLMLIDDFAVPNDAGYGYDSYGESNVLNASYLQNIHKDLRVFYPRISSKKETGSKRGCCAICLADNVAYNTLERNKEYFVEGDLPQYECV